MYRDVMAIIANRVFTWKFLNGIEFVEIWY